MKMRAEGPHFMVLETRKQDKIWAEGPYFGAEIGEGRKEKNWGKPQFLGRKSCLRRQNSSEKWGRQAPFYRSYLPSIAGGAEIRSKMGRR